LSDSLPGARKHTGFSFAPERTAMKTTTLEMEEEARLHTEGDPEAPAETSVAEEWTFDGDAVYPAAPTTPEHETIAQRAYERWHARGCPHGSPEEDWYAAEKELRGQKRNTAA
jgi:hypothetical protein